MMTTSLDRRGGWVVGGAQGPGMALIPAKVLNGNEAVGGGRTGLPVQAALQVTSRRRDYIILQGRNSRLSLGTWCPCQTGSPAKRASSSAEARPCPSMPQSSILQWSRITHPAAEFLQTAPDEAATSPVSWRSAEEECPTQP